MATAPPGITYAFREERASERPVPISGKQEHSQELHGRLRPNWPDLCHLTTPSGKVKRRRVSAYAVESAPFTLFATNTY